MHSKIEKTPEKNTISTRVEKLSKLAKAAIDIVASKPNRLPKFSNGRYQVIGTPFNLGKVAQTEVQTRHPQQDSRPENLDTQVQADQ